MTESSSTEKRTIRRYTASVTLRVVRDGQVMKRCRLCQEVKDLGSFTAHKATADRISSECRSCQRETSAAWRKKNVEHKRIQDAEYRSNPAVIERHRISHLRYKAANPEVLKVNRDAWKQRNKHKIAAHTAIGNAVAAGKVTRLPCWCGNPKSEGHHEDYTKPLEVIWLCRKHHAEAHRKIVVVTKSQEVA